jgi:hypothetical protein
MLGVGRGGQRKLKFCENTHTSRPTYESTYPHKWLKGPKACVNMYSWIWLAARKERHQSMQREEQKVGKGYPLSDLPAGMISKDWHCFRQISAQRRWRFSVLQTPGRHLQTQNKVFRKICEGFSGYFGVYSSPFGANSQDAMCESYLLMKYLVCCTYHVIYCMAHPSRPYDTHPCLHVNPKWKYM